MIFKTSQENLLAGVQIVQNIVSSKSPLPILANILLEVKGTKLRLNTTDLDIGISCEIPVDIIEEGAITIPAKRFGDIVRELPSGDITISVKKNNQVDIEGKQCRFKLGGFQRMNFQNFRNLRTKKPFKSSNQPLKKCYD